MWRLFSFIKWCWYFIHCESKRISVESAFSWQSGFFFLKWLVFFYGYSVFFIILWTVGRAWQLLQLFMVNNLIIVMTKREFFSVIGWQTLFIPAWEYCKPTLLATLFCDQPKILFFATKMQIIWKKTLWTCLWRGWGSNKPRKNVRVS